jgi:hypothetical protein
MPPFLACDFHPHHPLLRATRTNLVDTVNRTNGKELHPFGEQFHHLSVHRVEDFNRVERILPNM